MRKILNRAGFDYDLLEDLKPYVKVQQVCASPLELHIIHGNRQEHIPHERLGVVENDVRIGAEMYQSDLCHWYLNSIFRSPHIIWKIV